MHLLVIAHIVPARLLTNIKFGEHQKQFDYLFIDMVLTQLPPASIHPFAVDTTRVCVEAVVPMRGFGAPVYQFKNHLVHAGIGLASSNYVSGRLQPTPDFFFYCVDLLAGSPLVGSMKAISRRYYVRHQKSEWPSFLLYTYLYALLNHDHDYRLLGSMPVLQPN